MLRDLGDLHWFTKQFHFISSDFRTLVYRRLLDWE